MGQDSTYPAIRARDKIDKSDKTTEGPVAVSDIDILRTANLLMKQHGENAWTEACVRYFDLKDKGDQAGMDVWRRVAKAISDFTSKPPNRPLN